MISLWSSLPPEHADFNQRRLWWGRYRSLPRLQKRKRRKKIIIPLDVLSVFFFLQEEVRSPSAQWGSLRSILKIGGGGRRVPVGLQDNVVQEPLDSLRRLSERLLKWNIWNKKHFHPEMRSWKQRFLSVRSGNEPFSILRKKPGGARPFFFPSDSLFWLQTFSFSSEVWQKTSNHEEAHYSRTLQVAWGGPRCKTETEIHITAFCCAWKWVSES